MSANLFSDRVSITVDGKEQTIAAFSMFDLEVKRQVMSAVQESAEAILLGAQAGIVSRSGTAKRSIRKRELQEGLAAVVRAGAKHASYIEYGSGPRGTMTQREAPANWSHKPTIKQPRPAKIAVWMRLVGLDTKKVNPFVIARAIKRAGGVRARPFLGPVTDVEIPRFTDRVIDAIQGSIKKVDRGPGGNP